MYERKVVLNIPSYGMTRQYILSFVNALDKEKISLRIEGNKVEVGALDAPLQKVFADAFYIAGNRLRNYIERKGMAEEETDEDGKGKKKGERKPRMDIPASGNEKEILVKVKRDLKLPQDASFVDVFHQLGEYLEGTGDDEFQSLVNGKKIHSPLSIFKPELYQFTRGPYFDGKLKSEEVSGDEAKLSTWEFLIRLAGYAISRVGIIMIPSGNKPLYLTVLALPTDVNYSRSSFEQMLSSMREFPGFRPEEGMMMWMAVNLPEYLDELLVVGMKNPGGTAPAEIRIGFNVPLSSYRTRASEFLSRVKKNEKQKSLEWMIRTAMWEKEADTERELLKLMFMASQGDRKSKEELMLRSSRLLLSASEPGNKDAERLIDYCRNLAYTIPLLP